VAKWVEEIKKDMQTQQPVKQSAEYSGKKRRGQKQCAEVVNTRDIVKKLIKKLIKKIAVVVIIQKKEEVLHEIIYIGREFKNGEEVEWAGDGTGKVHKPYFPYNPYRRNYFTV